MSIPLLTRIERRLDLDGPGGCWFWTGSRINTGYELVVAAVPRELQMDHLCRVPLCANPDHLEPVTRKVNAERGVKATAVACLRGHLFDDVNTMRKSNGTRRCRECHNARRRKVGTP
jgi:hypothetical protein